VAERGNLVALQWQGRGENQLGRWAVEPAHNYAVHVMDDPLKLGAMLAACALCDAALPEKEGHSGLFRGLRALLDCLDADEAMGLGGVDRWGPVYVMWEIAFLRELGFGLDLSRCVAGGDPMTLEWVSPKSGCAVSKEKGAPYADKLLPLPGFLKPHRSGGDAADVVTGLRLTGYFLEHWAFAQCRTGIPDERRALLLRAEKAVTG
jgi:DNA repair protein RecO (recombination protein O)